MGVSCGVRAPSWLISPLPSRATASSAVWLLVPSQPLCTPEAGEGRNLVLPVLGAQKERKRASLSHRSLETWLIEV